MTAQGYTLAPRSWHPLPCGGRALVREHYVPHVEHSPERRSKKATQSSKTALVSIADAEAKMRTGELPLPQLNAKERKRYAPGFFGQEQDPSAARIAGAKRGSEAQRAKWEAWALAAMREQPSLQRQGSYTITTGTIERHNAKPSFRVRCDCGVDGWVECGQWIRRTAPKSCAKCSSTRKGKTRAAREREAVAAE
jgi:hypothetical protein